MITNFTQILSLRIIGLSIVLLFALSSCASLFEPADVGRNSLYYNDNDIPQEPGKCYAKCMMPGEYEVIEKEILAYTGDDFDRVGVMLQKIVMRAQTTKWEKKKADINCTSRDPNDCLVWCLVKVPEISEEHYVVVDTHAVKDFKVEVLAQREIIKPGGYTEWREVVCEQDVTQDLYFNIQIALIQAGYGDDLEADGVISRATKNALVKYQRENGLPVGSLDYETIEKLGIDF